MNSIVHLNDVVAVVKSFVCEHDGDNNTICMAYEIGARILGVSGLCMMNLAEDKDLCRKM